jgi:DNA polymerase-1
VIYGISGFGLARNLRIPRAEAQGFIDRYFERFPGIRPTWTTPRPSRRKRLRADAVRAQDPHARDQRQGPGPGFAARAAINAPIQGTAADVIRRAMIRMEAPSRDLPAKMLLQVHDELLFEVDEGRGRRPDRRRPRGDGGRGDPAVHLDVPLVVDAGQGANWAEAH